MLSTKAGGSIVNFSSAAGITGHTEGFPYTAAKAGVAALTKSLAYYYGPEIRVNAVAPGNINAGSIRWYDGKGKDYLQMNQHCADLAGLMKWQKQSSFLLRTCLRS